MPIINMVYKKKKIPWWNISSDTICYLRLRGNLTDEVGNYTWTSWANLTYNTSVANIPVAYMTYDNWYAYTTTNAPQLKWSNSYTISWWVKQTSNAMCILNVGYTLGNYNWLSYYKFLDGSTYKWYFVMYLWWYSWSNWFEFQYNYNPWTSRHLWTCTYTPWTRKIYLDGVQVSTGSSTLTPTVTPTKPIEIWRMRWDSWNNPTAYYSDILFDGKARTAQEISDYYNLTKSNYQSSGG